MNIPNNQAQDLLRNIIAWFLLVLSVVCLWTIKPKVDVYERTMYLPLVTNRDAISNGDVSILRSDNYFLYNKIGYITVTIPDANDDNSKLRAIGIARNIAANAGAEKLLLEGMRSSLWFDSGKRVLRLHAIAMSQS